MISVINVYSIVYSSSVEVVCHSAEVCDVLSWLASYVDWMSFPLLYKQTRYGSSRGMLAETDTLP